MKDIEKYLPWIIGGIALYFVWQKLQAVGDSVGNSVPQSVIDYIANPGGPVSVNAQILLPNGQIIDVNSIALDDSMTFYYAGKRFGLTGRNSQNYYVAVLA